MSDEKNPSSGEGVQLSLREQLLGRLSDDDISSKKREVSVMTRMSADIVEILDALVELEIFKSRSEAVSAFVEQAITTRMKLFEEIKTQAADIRQLRDSAKKHAYEAFQEDNK
jgi:Arc/MetJ-type ribon-helix-helix transcriptional regulator